MVVWFILKHIFGWQIQELNHNVWHRWYFWETSTVAKLSHPFASVKASTNKQPVTGMQRNTALWNIWSKSAPQSSWRHHTKYYLSSRDTGCNRMAGKEDSNSTGKTDQLGTSPPHPSYASATSLEDKTEDFAGNPTRDALADGLMCMIKVGSLNIHPSLTQ